MNKKTFTLLLAVLFILKVSAQQVEEVQRTLISKRTATWCINCGTWGWTLMDGLIEDNQEKAVIMAAHESGLLQTNVAKEITDNWGAFSQPRFFVNENDFGVTSSQTQNARVSIRQEVDAAFTQMPVANSGFNWVFENNTLKVDAKVKFFQNASGAYYLGLYLIEDNVLEIQSGHTGQANHKKVLRSSFTNESWGTQFANGSVSAGTEFDLDFELQLGGIDGYDYEVAAIVWKKENDVYIPVNAFSRILDNTTSVNEVENLTLFRVMPTVTSGEATIQLQLSAYEPATSLDLVNTNGQQVANLHKGPLGTGIHSFSFNREDIPVSGLYFLRFTDHKGIRTTKVVVQ